MGEGKPRGKAGPVELPPAVRAGGGERAEHSGREGDPCRHTTEEKGSAERNPTI